MDRNSRPQLQPTPSRIEFKRKNSYANRNLDAYKFTPSRPQTASTNQSKHRIRRSSNILASDSYNQTIKTSDYHTLPDSEQHQIQSDIKKNLKVKVKNLVGIGSMKSLSFLKKNLSKINEAYKNASSFPKSRGSQSFERTPLGEIKIGFSDNFAP